jgi:hypothetical protein
VIVEQFRIETESEADAYLKDVLGKPEYRSMDEVNLRAHQYIKDERLRLYFINKAKELLAVG